MRGLKALIFDVDGTLAETEEVHRAAFNDAFKAAGLSWVWDQPLYRTLLAVSGGRERIIHYVEAYDPPGGADALRRLDEIHAVKSARFTRLVDDRNCPFRPGVERLLEEAKAKRLTLVLASTTSIASVESLIIANLDYAGLDRFHAIVGGDSVPARKPAPDIYRMALEAAGVAARNCLVIEDSLNGLRAATAAGLRTVVTPSVYTAHQDFGGALAVVSHLGDPFEPYEHLGGAGERDRMVTVPVLRRWMEDDDDMRSLLTIGGRSIY